jgi:WD40 repeat protein
MPLLHPRSLILPILILIVLFPPRPCGGQPAPAPVPIFLGDGFLRSGRPWAFTADSKGLFTQDNNGIHLWDAATGKAIRSFGSHFTYTSPTRSGDGATIAACILQRVIVWDVATGRQIASLALPPTSLNNPTLSHDGKKIAWTTRGGISMVDVASGKEIAMLATTEDDCRSFILRFSPDGAALAASGSGIVFENNVAHPYSTVRIWDIAAEKLALSKKFDEAGTPSLAFSPDSRRLLSSGSALHLWDVAASKELALMAPDGSHHGSLAFAPDGKSAVCITMELDGSWSAARIAVADAELRAVSRAPLERAASVLSDDGTFAAFGGASASIVETATARPFGVDAGPNADTRSAAFIGDGSSVVTVADDGVACVWETATGKLLKKVDLHVQRIVNAAVSRDGATLVATDDMRIYGIDMASGNQLHASRPSIGRRVSLAAISPDGKRVAAAGRLFDRQMHWGLFIWSSRVGGTPRVERAVPAVSVSDICWSPDGQIVAAGGMDGTVHLFQSDTGTEKRITLQVPGQPPANGAAAGGWRATDRSIVSIDISPDSRLLAASTFSGDVALWEASTGRLTRLLHVGSTSLRVRFDPRGFALATMESNADIHFFEVATGLKIASLHCGRPIQCWNISPDGRWIVTAGEPTDNAIWKSPLPASISRPNIPAATDELGYDRLWAEMAGPDAGRAFQAASDLAAGGEPALQYLAAHLTWPPAPPAVRATVTALIADLSADDYRTRFAAEVKLRDLGGQARPQLIEVLKTPPFIDAANAVERLLEEGGTLADVTPDEARRLRAIAALDQIGGPDASKVLANIWNTATSSEAAAEARAAMGNIRSRGVEMKSEE